MSRPLSLGMPALEMERLGRRALATARGAASPFSIIRSSAACQPVTWVAKIENARVRRPLTVMSSGGSCL